MTTSSFTLDFREVVERLPSAQRDVFARCTSYKAFRGLMRGMHAFRNHEHAGRWRECVRRFGERLECWFGVGGLMGEEGMGEIRGMIWGLFGVIVEVLRDSEGSFGRLMGLVRRVAGVFPDFEGLEVLVDGNGESGKRIGRCAEVVCGCVLELLWRVLVVFGVVGGDMVAIPREEWKPFHMRVEGIVSRIEACGGVVEEIRGLHAFKGKKGSKEIGTLTVEVLDKWQEVDGSNGKSYDDSTRMPEERGKTYHDDLLEQLRSSLASPANSFSAVYEKSLEIREEGTSVWLAGEMDYKDWLNDENPTELGNKEEFNSKVFWVTGYPGSGKTVLAASSIQHLRDNSTNPVWYFFFETRPSDTEEISTTYRITAYRAILSQILQQSNLDEWILDIFSYSMLSMGEEVTTVMDLEELFILLCQRIGKAVLVLDGIGECKDSKMLVLMIQRIAERSAVKVLLFGRHTVELPAEKIGCKRRISMSKHNEQDIKLYLTNKLNVLKDGRSIPANTKALEMVDQLTRRADGIFLWARLFWVYISSPSLTTESRKEILAEGKLPKRPEKICENILQLVFSQEDPHSALARNTFMWLLHRRRELAPPEIKEALKLSQEDWKTPYDDKLFNFDQSVVDSCGGLIELGPSLGQEGRPFRFTHSSIREFLLSLSSIKPEKRALSTAPEYFIPAKENAHSGIATCCLRYMTYFMPTQPLSGTLGIDPNKENLKAAFPFSTYAAIFWPMHLLSSLESTSKDQTQAQERVNVLADSLSNFVHKPIVLMAWIEASYLLHGDLSIQNLQQWSKRILLPQSGFSHNYPRLFDIASVVLELCRDLEELQSLWKSQLVTNPACIWEEVSVTTESRFLARNSGIIMHTLKPDNLPDPLKHGRELTKVSRTVSHGEDAFLAVLRIWPSREFDDFYHSRLKPVISVMEICGYSSGWAAQLETYATKSGDLISSIYIALDSEEVQLQILQSLWQDEDRVWFIQFPISISPDAHHFTILRTLHLINPSSVEKYTSNLLPLEFNDANAQHWLSLRERIEKGDTSLKYVRVDDHYERQRSTRCYLYWVFFDEKSQYVCFVDQSRCVPNNLYMMQFRPHVSENSPTRPALRVVARIQKFLKALDTSFEGYSFDKRRFHIAFHPSLSLLAIAASTKLYLWEFLDERNRGTFVLQAKANMEKLSFSNCGKYFVLSFEGENTPTIIEVPSSYLQNIHTNAATTMESTLASQQQGTLLQTLSHATFSSTRILSSIDTTIAPSGHTNITQIQTTNSGIIAKRWKGKPNEGLQPESVHLTRLPSRPESSLVQPDVLLPRDGQENVRIVMNIGEKGWNNFVESAERRLPVIVERDPRTLREGEKESKKDSTLLGNNPSE